MSNILKYASAAAIAVTSLAALAATDLSMAVEPGEAAVSTPAQSADSAAPASQDHTSFQTEAQTADAFVAPGGVVFEEPVVQPIPDEPTSLAALVDDTPLPGQLDSEMNCLAGAIYFEAKSESLAGQLAVGRVIIARAESDRFPDSYCGVVFQRGQFSFVRGGAMPAINKSSQDWHDAVRIARIAQDESWESPVEGALFFHARHVSPGWRLTRLATVDNHIFYR